MSGFYGYESVGRDRDRFRDYTGKLLTSAVLYPSDGSAAVTYANAYLWPYSERTGLPQGPAVVSARATIWRMGEGSRPRAEDTLSIGGFSWSVNAVTSERNADESSGYAVYQLELARAATSAG